MPSWNPTVAVLGLLLATVSVGAAQEPVGAGPSQLQDDVDELAADLARLERRISNVRSDLEDRADQGLVLFLYGVFCALWARNTGRGPWLWFFVGLLFSVITVVVLLMKNAEDCRREEAASQAT